MEYNDFQMPTNDKIEQMAREYNKTLLKKGFMFVRLNEESGEQKILEQSIIYLYNNTFNMLNKLYEFSSPTSKNNVSIALTYFKDTFTYVQNHFGHIRDKGAKQFALGNYLKTKNLIIQNISKIALNLLEYKQKYENDLDLLYFYDNLFKIIGLLSIE